jgi:ribose transport system permease protein
MSSESIVTETNAAVVAPLPASPTSPSSGWRIKALEAYALLGLLVAVAVFFSVWSRTGDTFSSAANLRILVANQAVIGIVALGALIPLIANEWDLSVGANAGVAAIFSASAMSSGRPVLVAIPLALGIGTSVGVANALLVTRIHVNGVITTLGMSTILAGVINQKTGGRSVASNIPSSVTEFGSRNWLGIPRVVFVLAIVALGVYYLLDHTPFGRYLYALGSNPRAARLVGLRTTLIVAASFVLAGVLSGAAGVLQVARQAGADPRVGEGFTLPALAAAFLSAASIKPGKYNVGGTLVAIFFLATLNSGLSLAGAPAYVSRYVNGAALIIGVGLAAFLGRRRLRAAGS